MSLMARGMSMIARTLSSASGSESSPVVITPADGLGTITVLDAVLGRQEINVTTPGLSNVRREHGEQEFLIPVASLVRNGATVLPAAGDRYAVTINDVPLVFQVMQADGKAAYDFSDPATRMRLRVRTKRHS